MRKSFFVSLSIAALLAVGGNSVYSQQNKPQTANPAEQQQQQQPCQELTAEQYKQLDDKNRKQYDEEIKKCKETLAANAKIKNATEVVNRVLKEGNDAYSSKNYDVAIAKYDEGYNADTEYWGTAPVLLINKAAALRSRGVNRFNEAVKTKDAAGKDAAKKDFQDSVVALDKALEVYNKSQKPADAAQGKNFDTGKFNALTDRAESYRLLVKADNSKAPDALKAYQEYLVVETDAAKKSKAQFIAADMALEAGDLDLASTEFQKIVEQDPSNTKAIYKLGLATIAVAANTGDKTKYQEGVNHLQRFVDNAPDTDTDKAYAKATIEAMKAEQNVAPQKGAGKSAAKRKS